jgi:flagellar hook-basal body complex protein FliE
MIGAVQGVAGLSLTRGLDELSGTQSSGASSFTQGMGAANSTAGADFGATLSSLASNVTTSLRAAEQASFDGIAGTADTRQVVDAVMTAEQSLQTALAIRDKLVTAYLEISRMQI